MREFDPNPSLKIPVAAVALGLGLAALNVAPGYIADAQHGSQEAVKVAEKNGYTNVDVTDIDHVAVSLRGCGDGDKVKYEMTATAPNGVPTDLFACGSITKALTLRFPQK